MAPFLKFFGGPMALVALAVASFLDTFVVVIPTDGLMVATVVTGRRRWVGAALAPAAGSVLGAAVLAWIASHYGPSALDYFAPKLQSSATWTNAHIFLENWGDAAIFLTGLSPFGQQPIVLILGLAQVPLLHIVVALFAGRFIKNLAICYVARRSPELVQKLPWIGPELKDVLQKLDQSSVSKPG